jgi:hypothetical protein
VIPQGNAIGDDVNFCRGSGACPANAGDGGSDCGSNTAGEVVDCSWIKMGERKFPKDGKSNNSVI